jgi:Arc/MetJ family transcription regulator
MTEIAVKKQHSEPEIDEDLLEEAQRQIGAAWPNEAINAALRELVDDRRARRLRALENLQRMADEGGLDFDAIDEADR